MATEGKEDGVDWVWHNCLDIGVKMRGIAAIKHLRAHSVHSGDIGGMGGNEFYGSFSIIYPNGGELTTYHHPGVCNLGPSKTEHTEPQYFRWLETELDENVTLEKFSRPNAFVIEMNQMNTPCSRKTCRKKILSCVSTNEVSSIKFDYVIARMSANSIYESSYPKIMPTSFEIKAGKKTKNEVLVVLSSMCIHKYPAIE